MPIFKSPTFQINNQYSIYISFKSDMSSPSTLLWSPSDPSSSQMVKFMNFVNDKRGLNLGSYSDLYSYSVSQISQFWQDVFEYTNIKTSLPYECVVEENKPMDAIPKWFVGARINFAERILCRSDDDQIAIYGTGEDGRMDTLTWKQLHSLVSQAAASFRKNGITKGDRIAAYIPNCIEAVICYLAAASIGAIWSSASPDFGVLGVLDRFQQIKPKILVSVNAVVYNGKTHDHINKLADVVKDLDGLEKVIVIPFVKNRDVDLSLIRSSVSWSDFLNEAPANVPLEFERVPFDHPLAILYSSGTTGKPKCIVHSQGGTLIQHLKEHILHGSLGPKDVFFYYTTTGWMMWNWLVSGLGTGAAIVLYDGSPFKPTPNHLWELIDKLGITAFGTSAKFISSLEDEKLVPNAAHSLKTLHTIYSTGSPLKPESFDYIYKCINDNVVIGSITGGTDIISLFAGHNTMLPVYRGEIQCRCLGMAVESWIDDRRPILDESGDLVCTKPFPAMPVSFWNDTDGSKYRSAYFEKFPGVWYHGDFLIISSKTGGVFMLGRSDGTLKPAGVRFGSAELYNVMTQFVDEVADSLVVGQRQDHDERVVMFCKMVPGKEFSPDLVSRIRARIRSLLSPRHVPAVILEIQDIPYTLTGKKVEVAVKRILSGEKVAPSSSLANPESLDLYYQILPQLQ